MTQLCFVSPQAVHTLSVVPYQEYVLPVSLWQKLRVEDDQLVFPAGWLAEGTDGHPLKKIGLNDANYTLKSKEWTGKLLVRACDEGNMETVVCLTSQRFTIGRSRKNDICYRDSFLSTNHGVFSYDGQGRLCYTDDSTNGTFINGKKLHRAGCVLQDGDQLDFPPLVRLVVSGSRLFIRYPNEQAEVHLSPCPPDDGRKLVSLCFGGCSGIYHVFVEPMATRSSFLSAARLQLPEEMAALLADNAVLQDANSRALIHSDALMNRHLQQASPCFLVL